MRSPVPRGSSISTPSSSVSRHVLATSPPNGRPSGMPLATSGCPVGTTANMPACSLRVGPRVAVKKPLFSSRSLLCHTMASFSSPWAIKTRSLSTPTLKRFTVVVHGVVVLLLYVMPYMSDSPCSHKCLIGPRRFSFPEQDRIDFGYHSRQDLLGDRYQGQVRIGVHKYGCRFFLKIYNVNETHHISLIPYHISVRIGGAEAF